MKRLYVIFLFLSLWVCAQPALAQLKYGVSGGLIMKELDLTKLDSEVSRQGWFVGPTLEIGLPLGLKVDGSLHYTHYELEYGSEVMKHNFLSIPLNLKWCIGLPKLVSFYLAGGPQFDNRLDGSEKVWECFQGDKFELSKNRMSWNVGGGFRVLSRIQVGITYNIVKKESGEDLLDCDSFRKNSWRVGATVLF